MNSILKQTLRILIIFATTFALITTNHSVSAGTPPPPTDDFVITVKTDNAGTSNDDQFIIPTFGSGYNYNVDCNNDGYDEDTGQTGDYTCIYAEAGTYTIRIKDNTGAGTGFPRIYFNDGGDKLKLLTIEQWGKGKWLSMENAFSACANLTLPATDTPDLVNVTNMSYMFYEADAFNGDIGDWDTSNVTNMRGMFLEANAFNGDIGGWNTSNVRDMSYMFLVARAFNQDLEGWDTSSVTDMTAMFYQADAFNGDISTWDTSSVTSFRVMFSNNITFNGDISAWDTSRLKDMAYMFAGASEFDQNLGGWNVEAVTDATGMFLYATLSTSNYDALLTGWDAQNLQPNLIFDGGYGTYYNGEPARAHMIASDNWTITDGGKFSAPANLQASDGTSTTKVQLTWSASNGATSYKVFRTTSWGGPKTPLGTRWGVDNTTFADTTATPGVTNIYWVKACFGATCSNFSNSNTGWKLLSSPSNLQASDGTSAYKVGLTWTASNGATSYRIYRATSAGGSKTLLGSRTGTSFADSTATPGLTYHYWVKACYGTNCSAYSARNTGWRKLSPPTNLQASDGTFTTKVQLTWTASSGATSYKVYRAASAGGAKTLLGTRWGENNTAFSDKIATPGHTYTYWVKAFRGTRFSAFSAYNTGWR